MIVKKIKYQQSDKPKAWQIGELVDIFLERMGLTEHQTVYALHHNTEHFHVHVAVNRTHPDTLKVVQPHKGFDIEVAHQIVALVEHKQGWLSTENARYTVLENGGVTRARREQKLQPLAPTSVPVVPPDRTEVQQLEKYLAAVVLESSPGNYQ